MKYTLKQIEKIEEELSRIDTEEIFEEVLNDLYGEVDICGYKVPAGNVLKEIDPNTFGYEESNWISNEVENGNITEIGGDYYWTSDIKELDFEDEESEEEDV